MNETPTLREAFKQFIRLVSLIRPYWASLIKGMLIGLVTGLIGMVIPYLSKLLIDKVYPSHDVTLMNVLVSAILGITVASAFVGAIRGYFTLYIGTRLSNATSLMFFNHLQHLTVKFFDGHRVGEIMSRFQDVRSSLNSITKVFQTLFVQGIYLILVPPFLFLLEWKLALVALVGIPLTITITALSGRLLRRYWKRTSEAYAELNAFQVEILSHIRTLKAAALEHFVFKKASEHIDGAIRVQLKAGGLGQIFGTANGILRALNTAILTWYGWTLILSQEITLGDYIAFTIYIGYLYGPISQFVSLFSEFQQSAVNLGRMFEYLDSPVEQDPSYAYLPSLPIQFPILGNIRLHDVSFGYTPEKQVLNNINLDIPNSKITTIVGPSGSGKTTLLRLLTRMEEPDSGQVFIDDISVSQIPFTDLRRQISVVWQEQSLMKGTIWENLTLGNDSPNRKCVDEAVQLCRLDELIKSLPNGYQTTIAEWGASLSGGQRQRLLIARALIRNTPIILLDEATSNIDVRNEMEILHDLTSLLKGKTVIFITHRVATAALADRICMLESGRVVGVGTHQELLNNNDFYCRMHGISSVAIEDRQLKVAEKC